MYLFYLLSARSIIKHIKKIFLIWWIIGIYNIIKICKTQARKVLHFRYWCKVTPLWGGSQSNQLTRRNSDVRNLEKFETHGTWNVSSKHYFGQAIRRASQLMLKKSSLKNFERGTLYVQWTLSKYTYQWIPWRNG